MIRHIVFALVVSAFAFPAGATCAVDGKPSQSVYLSIEGRRIERWQPSGPEIHRVRLPQGFELGVKIEPATAEKYRESFARWPTPAVDELVKIDLFDMSDAPPRLISTTWGGANSLQGFGPRGGANGVPIMRDQIELWFHKPVCVTLESMSAAR